MAHKVGGPKAFDLWEDVRKKKVNGRIVFRFRADPLSACKPNFFASPLPVSLPCGLGDARHVAAWFMSLEKVGSISYALSA